MTVFRHFKQKHEVYLSTTHGSYFILAKNNCFSKGKWEAPVCWTKYAKKETHMKKGAHMKICRQNRMRTIIFTFFLTSRSSLSSLNVGDWTIRFVSYSPLSIPACWNSGIFMKSLYLKTSSNSVYVWNSGEFPVCFFFPWFYCRLLLNF